MNKIPNFSFNSTLFGTCQFKEIYLFKEFIRQAMRKLSILEQNETVKYTEVGFHFHVNHEVVQQTLIHY